jgi:hypothetical protein
VAAPASTSESDDQQAGGLFSAQDAQRLQVAAARIQVPVPAYRLRRPDPSVPANFRKFIGVWASKVGFANGRGRQIVLIITDVDATGRVSGHYAYGPPTPTTPENFPASSVVFSGQIERDTLKFTLRVGVFTVKLAPGDNMIVNLQRRDGLTPTAQLDAIWRLAEREGSANRQIPRQSGR